MPDVLSVYCNGTRTGSAFVSDGVVLTAAHLIHDCGSPIVVKNETGGTVSFESQDLDEKLDIALLRPSTQVRTGFHLRRGELTVGASVLTLGFPFSYLGVKPLLIPGTAAGFAPTEPQGPTRVWISAAINPGNSGGPIIDSETGEVVGLVTGSYVISDESIQKMQAAIMRQTSIRNVQIQDRTGKTYELGEWEAVGRVLGFGLASQGNLGLGHATSNTDLVTFFQAHH